MIQRRYCHKSVAVKNKLYLVGGNLAKTCEVFNSITNKFCFLKQPKKISNSSLNYPTEVIAIGSKLNFFFDTTGTVKVYDFDSGKWSENTCNATKKLMFFSCVKLPMKSF